MGGVVWSMGGVALGAADAPVTRSIPQCSVFLDENAGFIP